jgi:uncharacterized protein YaeQ
LSNAEEPALWIRDMQGNLRAWIEIGTPSAERLHKASKGSPRVVVFTHNDPDLLKKAARTKAIHKAEAIEVFALDGAFLDGLDAVTDRNAKWTLVRSEGVLYVTCGETNVTTPITAWSLID